jgi:glycosyltransferase involved in cell wall biosynthesis
MGRVDVVIPCYNYGRFLRQCVESVLAQSPISRILIIDDASPDDTPKVATELVKRDARVFYTRHSENHGHIATYNEGLLEWASADYSLLLSADDYLLPGALARAVTLMDRHPEVGFTFGPAIKLSPGDPPVSVVNDDTAVARVMSGVEYIEMSGSQDLVPTATAVVRSALQKQLGGYRRDLPHAGDMEMWLRFAGHGGVGMFDSPQAVYRRHGSNMSLSYYVAGELVLPDLEERAAVFEAFFDGAANRLFDLPRLRVKTVGALAEEAVWAAHFAFEAGHLDTCEKIAGFSAALYPSIRLSRPWVTLALKRRMGLRAWAALAPAAAALQRLAWPLPVRKLRA